jgi:hypothetical protein
MGFSFWKLVILGVVVYYLWHRLRRQQVRSGPRAGASAASGGGAARGARAMAVDLVKCPRCDAYVTKGSGHGCNRPDCQPL